MTPTGRQADSAVSPTLHRSDLRQRILVGLELFNGSTAVAVGVLLAVKPDGSLLRADPVVLASSPFQDWRLPGMLMVALVGGGFLAAGVWQWRGWRHARELSVIAGVGLVCFEAVEVAWIGFQPLKAVFALIGAAVSFLALKSAAAKQQTQRRQRGGR
jgi:hypothetical protein